MNTRFEAACEATLDAAREARARADRSARRPNLGYGQAEAAAAAAYASAAQAHEAVARLALAQQAAESAAQASTRNADVEQLVRAACIAAALRVAAGLDEQRDIRGAYAARMVVEAIAAMPAVVP